MFHKNVLGCLIPFSKFKHGSFHEAHLAVVGEQAELSSTAADLMDTAGPWEVAGRRGSELTGMHLSTT